MSAVDLDTVQGLLGAINYLAMAVIVEASAAGLRSFTDSGAELPEAEHD